MPQPLRVFFSYAHEDDRFRIRLEQSLKLLERQGLVESWHDRKLLPGDDWAREIDSRLERAELILFLVSPDFIDSDYCWGVEMTRALARHDAGEALVVPLIIRPVGDWQTAKFGRLQALLGGKAVTSWGDEDAAWAEVARELRRLVERFQPGGAAAAVPPAGPADSTRYLEALELEHSFVEIRGMGAQVAEQLPLDRVYTRLRVGPSGRGAPDPPGKAPQKGANSGDLAEPGGYDLELADVLRDHRHAVLIGDPGSGKTTFLPTPVGIYPRGATPEGIFDLAGNVLEWCSDWLTQPYPAGEVTDPPGPAQGASRVSRGGSFINEPGALRGAYRFGYLPGFRDDYVGCRVVWGSAPGLD